MRRYADRRPVEAAAITAASRPDPWHLAASTAQLYRRLARARDHRDRAGSRLLSHLIARNT